MSKFSHNSNQNLLRELATQSLHHTTAHSKLDTIATNTANIKLSADNVNLNVDTLEALQTTTNTTLAAILVDTDAADSSLNTIEANSGLTASRLNNIQNKISANVDGTGDTLGQIASNILSKNTDAETHLGNIDTGVDVLEACVGSNKVNVNIASGNISGFATESTLSAAEAHLGNIDTGVDALEACVGSNKVNVNISSGNISGFGTAANQSTIIGHVDGIETLIGSTNSALATIDGVLDNAEAHLGNIDAGVDVLEACVGSNKVNVNISSGNISGFGTAANQSTIIGHLDGVEGKLDTLETTLSAIETDIAANEVLLTAANGKHAANEALLGTIDSDTDAIKTSTAACATDLAAIEVLITAGNGKHAANEALLGTIDSDTDAIKTSTAACATDLAALEVLQTATNSALTTIDGVLDNAEAHLGNIDAGVDVLEACVGSNKVNVNISSGNISGFATQTTLAAAEAHLGNIDTGVDVLEACVASNKVKTLNTADISEGVWLNSTAVNSTSFSASLETTGYTKLRLYGDVDQDFSGAPPNIIVTGALTNGGVYTPLANSTDGIDTQSAYISGASVIGVNATIDNPPKFIKLYNLHGSTNFTFTLNYSLSN